MKIALTITDIGQTVNLETGEERHFVRFYFLGEVHELNVSEAGIASLLASHKQGRTHIGDFTDVIETGGHTARVLEPAPSFVEDAPEPSVNDEETTEQKASRLLHEIEVDGRDVTEGDIAWFERHDVDLLAVLRSRAPIGRVDTETHEMSGEAPAEKMRASAKQKPRTLKRPVVVEQHPPQEGPLGDDLFGQG